MSASSFPSIRMCRGFVLTHNLAKFSNIFCHLCECARNHHQWWHLLYHHGMQEEKNIPNRFIGGNQHWFTAISPQTETRASLNEIHASMSSCNNLEKLKILHGLLSGSFRDDHGAGDRSGLLPEFAFHNGGRVKDYVLPGRGAESVGYATFQSGPFRSGDISAWALSIWGHFG